MWKLGSGGKSHAQEVEIDGSWLRETKMAERQSIRNVECVRSRRSARVAVMKSTDLGKGHDLARFRRLNGFHLPLFRVLPPAAQLGLLLPGHVSL